MWTRINSNSGRFISFNFQVLKADKRYIPLSEDSETRLDKVQLSDKDLLPTIGLLSRIFSDASWGYVHVIAKAPAGEYLRYIEDDSL